MRPTPLTDALHLKCVRNPEPANGLIMTQHGRKLENLLGEARDAFKQIARNPGDFDDTGFTSGHISRDLLARIDATLAGANPDYVDAPMQVSVTTIDSVTGEVKQGVATSEEELNRMLGIETPLAELAKQHAENMKSKYFREYLRLAEEALLSRTPGRRP